MAPNVISSIDHLIQLNILQVLSKDKSKGGSFSSTSSVFSWDICIVDGIQSSLDAAESTETLEERCTVVVTVDRMYCLIPGTLSVVSVRHPGADSNCGNWLPRIAKHLR